MDKLPKRILIADDDEGIVHSLSMILESMGYEVFCILNGDKVISAVKTLPDLILLDIWISGVDGREICRKIRSDPATRAIPVLMISASEENQQSALDAGASDFLGKPFELKVLRQKVTTLLLKL